jgi:hypothetical protein
LLSFACARRALILVRARVSSTSSRSRRKSCSEPGEGLQHRPEAQVGEVVVDQAQRDAVDAAQGAQVNDVVAFINAKGFGDVAAGRRSTDSSFSLVGWLP